MTTGLVHGDITEVIIGRFYEVHNVLGFGYLENTYANALTRELRRASHQVAREVVTPVFYKGEPISHYRADMVVDDKVIVELKSTRIMPPEAERQVYNYLRATRFEVGLLLHFGPKAAFSRLFLSADHKQKNSAPLQPTPAVVPFQTIPAFPEADACRSPD